MILISGIVGVLRRLVFLLLFTTPLLIPLPPAGALTWNRETVDSAGTTGLYTSLAVDASGAAHISYWDQTNDDLRYARKGGSLLNCGPSSTWSCETVDSAGFVGEYTSLSLDVSGNPHISYYDCGNFMVQCTKGNLKYARKSAGVWSLETIDSAGNVGGYTSLALGSDGNPHISYWNFTNKALRYAREGGSLLNCGPSLTWSCENVGFAGGFFKDSSLAVDVSGNPHISYYDDINADLYYVKKSAGVWSIQFIDSAGITGLDSSLAVDVSGNPHISYYDLTNGELKYARKGGSLLNCGPFNTWSCETVDSAGTTGLYTSLSLDASGNPHITYHDFTNHDLRYARKGGSPLNCGLGAWSCETVDSAPGDTGRYTSLSLDASGNPHISYHDNTNDDLMYAAGDLTPPPAPTPVSPTDSATNDNTPTFDWTDVSDPSGVTYTLEVDNNPDFSSPEIQATGLAPSTHTPPTSLSDGAYSWRVRAVDGSGSGNLGSYSSIRTLTIDTVAPTAGAVSPTTVSAGSSASFSTYWGDTLTGVVSCSFYADNVLIGAATLTGGGTTFGTASKTHTFTSAGQHTARFNCSDKAGNTGAGTPTSITIAAQPTTPVSAISILTATLTTIVILALRRRRTRWNSHVEKNPDSTSSGN